MRLAMVSLACALSLSPAAVRADDDTVRIPAEALDDGPPPAAATPAAAAASGAAAPAVSSPPAAGSTTAYAELQAEEAWRRPLLVPVAPTAATRKVARALADLRATRALAPGWTADLSARYTAERVDDPGLDDGDDRLDLREAALTWQATPRDFLAAGRINVRGGVAWGVNPTDWFRTRSVVDPASRDPRVQRENRLGTVMLRAQHLFDGGEASVAYAPRLSRRRTWIDPGGTADPRLSRTNGDDRLLVEASTTLDGDVAPQVMAWHDALGWQFGLDVTGAVGQQATLYLEAAAARRRDTLETALDLGQDSGDLPPEASAFVPSPAGPRWRPDVAAGGTWSSAATRAGALTLALEIEWHPAGWSRDEWQRWTALGASGPDAARIAWGLRGIAGQRQDALSRHALFARAQWDRALVRDLSFTAFAFHDLDDRSTQWQLAADWQATPRDRVHLAWLGTRGALDSVYGSDPARHDALLAWSHYF